MYTQHSFCSFCGGRYNSGQAWPRICPHCQSASYRNPLPVVLLLLPVDDGLLVIRRSAAPRKGQLALPGGFIEIDERWQDAAARELHEETGITIGPETVAEFAVRSAPGGYLLVFGVGPAMRGADLPAFAPNTEASERLVITAPVDLAFPLHSEAVARFFALYGRRN